MHDAAQILNPAEQFAHSSITRRRRRSNRSVRSAAQSRKLDLKP